MNRRSRSAYGGDSGASLPPVASAAKTRGPVLRCRPWIRVTPRGRPGAGITDATADFGWVTTKVVARAARVNLRTVRRYIGLGKLEGESQGERVNQRWLVSVDSLHALRASRPDHADGPRNLRGNKASEGAVDNPADVLRTWPRGWERAAGAAQLRTPWRSSLGPRAGWRSPGGLGRSAMV